jgi:prevent-host-death family protein
MDTSPKTSPRWTIARAKQRFSELLRAAQRAPQAVYNRDRLVAVVVDAADFRVMAEARQKAARRSVGDAFAELRAICAQDDYILEVPERTTRANAFADILDELPR